MKPSKTYIYTLADPRTGFVRYVGKADNLKERFNRHLKAKGSTWKSCWIKALKALQMQPVMEVLEEVDQANWKESEQFWITCLKFLGCPLTNLTNGGEGVVDSSGAVSAKISKAMKGRKFSEEHKAKLSAARAGKKRGPYSEEHRRHISEGQKGKVIPAEQRARISATLKGRKLSTETRAKVSATLKSRNRKASAETRAKIGAHFKGKLLSLEHQKKLSESHKGILHSKEEKERTSISLLWSYALRRKAKQEQQPGGGISSASEIRTGGPADNNV